MLAMSKHQAVHRNEDRSVSSSVSGCTLWTQACGHRSCCAVEVSQTWTGTPRSSTSTKNGRTRPSAPDSRDHRLHSKLNDGDHSGCCKSTSLFTMRVLGRRSR
uniref:Uncharacterized protein n=1 Tax=Arundo donax TaxID=35708 RepID=A0A0A8Z929_ARUDO